ncbi:MAG: hypothetical protein WC044_01600 [Crocinitomicaceae bacterium]
MKENFTQVPNEILDNDMLSWDEKGVIATFFRNKRDWKAYKDEFISRSTDGKTVINRIFKSLEEKGFIDKKIEGGIRLDNGRFTPKETYFLLSNKSIELLDKNSVIPMKSTVSRQPNSGNQSLVTRNPLSATNKTNYNNTNNNNTKENKTNSVSVSVSNSDLLSQTELIEQKKTDTDTATDFILVEVEKETVELSTPDSIVENRVIESMKEEEVIQGNEKTQSNHFVEKRTATSMTTSTNVDGATQRVKEQATNKYFFNYREQPSLDRITAYATKKGYSTESAYEVFNVLVENDYRDSDGYKIQSIEKYINTMLKQKKKEIKPDEMKELRAISDAYAELYASELVDDRYGLTTHRLNMWDFTKFYLSTHDNDIERAKKMFGVLSSLKPSERPSSYKLTAMTKEALKKKALVYAKNE